VAYKFVDQVFRHVIGSPGASRTTEAVLRICVDPFFVEKEKALRKKLDELLRPYTLGYAMPLDSEFHRTRLERSRRQSGSAFGSEFATDVVIDMMETHYEVSTVDQR